MNYFDRYSAYSYDCTCNLGIDSCLEYIMDSRNLYSIESLDYLLFKIYRCSLFYFKFFPTALDQTLNNNIIAKYIFIIKYLFTRFLIKLLLIFIFKSFCYNVSFVLLPYKFCLLNVFVFNVFTFAFLIPLSTSIPA